MEMEQTSDSGCSSNDGMELSQGTRVIDTCPSENFVKILPNPSAPTSISGSLASSVPANFGSTHPLGDHIGMARPSYEAPAPATIYLVNTINHKNQQQLAKDHIYNSNSFQVKKIGTIWWQTKVLSMSYKLVQKNIKWEILLQSSQLICQPWIICQTTPIFCEVTMPGSGTIMSSTSKAPLKASS